MRFATFLQPHFIFYIQNTHKTIISISSSGTLNIGTNGSITVSGSNYGALSCSSSNTNIATCSVSGTTVTIVPKAGGSATITVTGNGVVNSVANYNSISKTYAATVTAYKKYNAGDKVYLDPTKPSTSCNESNSGKHAEYESGCRLYYVVTTDDTNSKETIELMSAWATHSNCLPSTCLGTHITNVLQKYWSSEITGYRMLSKSDLNKITGYSIYQGRYLNSNNAATQSSTPLPYGWIWSNMSSCSSWGADSCITGSSIYQCWLSDTNGSVQQWYYSYQGYIGYKDLVYNASTQACFKPIFTINKKYLK